MSAAGWKSLRLSRQIGSRVARPNLSSDDQELQEVLLDEYAQYWGVEREWLL